MIPIGDRRHVRIHLTESPDLYLYVHWLGEELATIVQVSLARSESRWLDEPYLARIIASDVFSAAGIVDLTGAGLGTDYMESPCDDDVIVDLPALEVRIGRRHWKFLDFCHLPGEKLLRSHLD